VRFEIAAHVLQADWAVDSLSLKVDLVGQRMTLRQSRMQLEIDPGKRPAFAPVNAIDSASDDVDEDGRAVAVHNLFREISMVETRRLGFELRKALDSRLRLLCLSSFE
jgi:hypothetical protein